MAGTLLSLNLFSPVTGTSPSRSTNLKFNPPQLIFSGNGANISKSLLHRQLRSVTGTIVVTNSAQGNGGSNRPGKPSNLLVSAEPLLNFVGSNFLPLALTGGVVLGLANPSLGCLADKYHVSKLSTFGIFIISGLTLRSEEIGAAAEAWPVGLFGLASILLFTPFFSRIILQLHLQPQEFVTGLALFCCMPTTLSSGVALTRLAGGNTALALAMTVLSSLLGILIVPFSISNLIAGGVGASVPAGPLFKSLIITLLIPLILGKVLRESFKGVADFADGNRKLLSNLNSLLLSLVPWIQVSRSRSLLLAVKPAVFSCSCRNGSASSPHAIGFQCSLDTSSMWCIWWQQISFCKEGKCQCRLTCCKKPCQCWLQSWINLVLHSVNPVCLSFRALQHI